MEYKDWKRLASEQEAICLVLRRGTNRISWLRLAAFGIAAGFFIIATISGIRVFYGAGILCLLGFGVLAIRHRKMEKRLSREQTIADIYARYGRRTDGSWREEEWAFREEDTDRPDAREKDLDLYGSGSLYQYLCVAETVYGRDLLRSWLRNDRPDPAEIRARQEAVKELSLQVVFDMEFRIALWQMHPKLEQSSREQIAAFIQEAEHTPGRSRGGGWILQGLSWLLPAATVLSFVLAFLADLRLAAVGSILAVLQFLLGLWGNAVFGGRLRTLSDFRQGIAPYQTFFEQIAAAHFATSYLKDKATLLRQEAVPAFRKLSGIREAVRIRFNPLGYMLCSMLFMWDFHCIRVWDRWRVRYGNYVSGWLQTVGEIEALLSLGTLARVRKQTVYPEISEGEGPELHFTDLAHPLIPEAEAIGNSFDLDSGVCVITGSNMSGKTTFMRTIGVNLALLYAGGPVCAAALRASAMSIRTSMRISDDIGEGLSTFYAEVLRIRDIVRFVDQGCPVLVLIDEIYKGTNSEDRAIGATATVERLAKSHTAVLVTTHDMTLCELSKQRSDVRNYHFTEHYEGDRLLFDYKILPGPAMASNARHLLRLAGILSEEDAKASRFDK